MPRAVDNPAIAINPDYVVGANETWIDPRTLPPIRDAIIQGWINLVNMAVKAVVDFLAERLGIDLMALIDDGFGGPGILQMLIQNIAAGDWVSIDIDLRRMFDTIFEGIRQRFGWDLRGLFGTITNIPGAVWDGLHNLTDLILQTVMSVPVIGPIIEAVLAAVSQFLRGIPSVAGNAAQELRDWSERLQADVRSALAKWLSPLNGNPFAQWRGSQMPAPHIVAGSPELLDCPNFDHQDCIASQEVWLWDETATIPGSARIEADGRPHTLISNPIQVTPGQRIPVKVDVKWAGLVAQANAGAIRLQINSYDWQGNRHAVDELARIASPAGTVDWQYRPGTNPPESVLSGVYVASTEHGPAGIEPDAWIAVRLDVTAAASAGMVWFARASTKTEDHVAAQIPSRLVAGVQGIFDMGATVQTQLNDLLRALAPSALIAGADATFSQVAQAMHNLARDVGLNLAIIRGTRIELGLPPITDTQGQVGTPGTHVMALPLEWDYVDLACVGGGGGGGSEFGVFNGQGGGAGQFAHITLIRAGRGLPVPSYAASSHAYIHGDATSVTAFVGAGGSGGIGAAGAPAPDDAQASRWDWTKPDGTSTIATGGTLVGARGVGGGSAIGGTNWQRPGASPNDWGIGPGVHTYNQREYFGGGNVAPYGFTGDGRNTSGQFPGGGGAGGALRLFPDFGNWGGHGNHGSCWMNAYTAEQPE